MMVLHYYDYIREYSSTHYVGMARKQMATHTFNCKWKAEISGNIYK